MCMGPVSLSPQFVEAIQSDRIFACSHCGSWHPNIEEKCRSCGSRVFTEVKKDRA